MKSTGIVRRVDQLGRVVLPIELRRTLQIGDKDSLEIYVEEENIVLRKYEPSCIFCGNADGISQYRGKNICPTCLEDLTRSAV
ncbi:MAG: AbrB/MazE/SpoVT family DNA-binding domain-containing protein [Thermaerobacter sp.]|nr:AbrB/MazE/SpoVT family DNA-binding domain-containing protein [Thermaerobacter sp.]